MSEPITVSNEDAAIALSHHHPKSKKPREMAFPGFGGTTAPGANGPPTTGAGGPPSVAPDVGGPAYADET